MERISPELLAEIKRLHFQTRHLADQGVSGQYRSAFRGRGIEFEEVREYLPGDDVRSIDWNVTARSGQPYIKTYREERELTVMIAVDLSASTLTGTRSQLRDELIAKVGAVLTLIAQNNNDKVGLVTFSDKIEKYHPPRKARGAVWRIIHEVLNPTEFGHHTDLCAGLNFLNKVLKRSSIVFLISDFVLGQTNTEELAKSLAILSKRHDVTAISIKDPADVVIPQAGLLSLRDPESGETITVDSSNPSFRREYEKLIKSTDETLLHLFRRHRVGHIQLSTDTAFMPAIRKYLSHRKPQNIQVASITQTTSAIA